MGGGVSAAVAGCRWSRPGVSRCARGGAQAVGVAVEVEVDGAVQEPVEEGGGGGGVAEDHTGARLLFRVVAAMIDRLVLTGAR